MAFGKSQVQCPLSCSSGIYHTHLNMANSQLQDGFSPDRPTCSDSKGECGSFCNLNNHKVKELTSSKCISVIV